MTERERWVVYPLLFLALGASLRDKISKQVVSDKIVCHELRILDDQERVVVSLGVSRRSLSNPNVSVGQICLNDYHGKNVHKQIYTGTQKTRETQNFGLFSRDRNRRSPSQVFPNRSFPNKDFLGQGTTLEAARRRLKGMIQQKKIEAQKRLKNTPPEPKIPLKVLHERLD